MIRCIQPFHRFPFYNSDPNPNPLNARNPDAPSHPCPASLIVGLGFLSQLNPNPNPNTWPYLNV